MCGIVGAVSLKGEGRAAHEFLEAAVASIRHRGPDANGIWRDQAQGIGLGHARLSILDLSPAGAQPMRSASGRFVVVFNGEIYNHLDLRAELQRAAVAPEWRGHSDTETVLACLEAWGIEATIHRLVGMFAFGIWDANSRALTLVRDRMGEKPLYYGRCADDFVFASELRAIRHHPRWVTEVDRSSLGLLLRFNYIPAPYTIHPGIRKLPAGSMITVSAAGGADPSPVEYWAPHRIASASASRLADITDSDAVDQLEALLTKAVKSQMLSDVPLGAFLSGGYDSSMVVALMQRQSSMPVKTFSLGFNETSFNEARHAQAVARHLRTEHTELYLTAKEARDTIAELPRVYDEPFADSSQIPTLLVSRLARRHVTVALTGDGADELLGGYGRYALGGSRLTRLSSAPGLFRYSGATLLRAMRSSKVDQILARSSVIRRRILKEDRLELLEKVLSSDNADMLGVQQSSQWKSPEEVVLGADHRLSRAETASEWLSEPDPTLRLMLIDMVTYLPGDILAKVDRASMSVGLETRVPFLDHRVVEFAVGLPMRMKLREGQTKWVLRRLLGRYVPAALTDRPKMGFSVPVDEWLRGPLRDWAEGLLAEGRLRSDGYFDPGPIRERWRQHIDGRYNWYLHLWSVLMFQSWLDEMRSANRSEARCAG